MLYYVPENGRFDQKGECSTMFEKRRDKKRVVGYVVDTRPGYYRYVNVEGVGECREHFMKLVNDIDQDKVDYVAVAGACLLFIDTSPMWMEKFVANVKQHAVIITDAESGKDYDLRKSEDEVAFRAQGRKKPGD